MKRSHRLRRASGGMLLFRSGILYVGGPSIFGDERSSQVIGWLALLFGVAGVVQGWRASRHPRAGL
jgi:hypothetical protein